MFTEEHFLEGLKKRDPNALSLFIDMYVKGVYTVVNRILSSDYSHVEDVEECVSDVFVAIWERINEFDKEKGSLKTWVYILAKYKALDYRRRLYKRTNLQEITDEHPDKLDLEERVVLKIETDEVYKFVDSFDEPDKTIFHKKFTFNESLTSIAEKTGLT